MKFVLVSALILVTVLGLVGGAPGGETRASPIRAHARALTTACANASADCGFWPVTKLPETTTCDVQGSPLLYLPPLPERPCSFDPEKGLTASVWPTYACRADSRGAY